MPFDAISPVPAPPPSLRMSEAADDTSAAGRGGRGPTVARAIAYAMVGAVGLVFGAGLGLFASLALGLISIGC
jgi:hypothetical protein